MDIITSRANPRIKQARALRTRRERDATGLFLVEGIAHVGAAVESGTAVEYICYAPDRLASPFARDLVARASANAVPCYPVSTEVLDSLASKDNPSGLLAVVHKPVTDLRLLMTDDRSLYVALLSPQDPGNIGAILRTIDAVNASGLILLDGGADPYHPSGVRASMGALFYKPVVSGSFAEFVDWARGRNLQIVGMSSHANTDHRAAQYQPPLILLMGNEQKGLMVEHTAACTQMIRLPMEGKVTSLNVAVATGVMLYEIRARTRN